MRENDERIAILFFSLQLDGECSTIKSTPHSPTEQTQFRRIRFHPAGICGNLAKSIRLIGTCDFAFRERTLALGSGSFLKKLWCCVSGE